MSDDNKISTANRLAHLEELVEEIHSYLIGGDKLKGGKPGLADVVEMHRVEIYGEEETGHEGLKPQVRYLMEEQKKMKYMIFGITSVASVVVIVMSNWSTIASWFK